MSPGPRPVVAHVKPISIILAGTCGLSFYYFTTPAQAFIMVCLMLIAGGLIDLALES